MIFTKQLHVVRENVSYLDVFAGIVFGLGAFTYIISAQLNGVTAAFIYSQLSVIISTIGSMVFLGEKKYGREFKATLLGLVLIVFGAIIQ